MKLIMLFVSVLLLANGVEAGNHKKKCRNLEKKREKCERTSRRDSFEYPHVSKFVAPSDFWLGFVAPVSAAPAPVSVPPRMTRTPVPPSRYIIATGGGGTIPLHPWAHAHAHAHNTHEHSLDTLP